MQYTTAGTNIQRPYTCTSGTLISQDGRESGLELVSGGKCVNLEVEGVGAC